MSRLDQIRRMSDDDLILFLRRYKSEDCLYIKRSGILQGRLCDFGFRALRNRRNKRKPPYVARQIGGGSGI